MRTSYQHERRVPLATACHVPYIDRILLDGARSSRGPQMTSGPVPYDSSPGASPAIAASASCAMIWQSCQPLFEHEPSAARRRPARVSPWGGSWASERATARAAAPRSARAAWLPADPLAALRVPSCTVP